MNNENTKQVDTTPAVKPNITAEEIQRIANLAKISLTPEQIQEFSSQIENILEWTRQIEELSPRLKNLSQEGQGAENLATCPEPRLSTFSSGDNIENNLDLTSSKLVHGYFKVPKVIE